VSAKRVQGIKKNGWGLFLDEERLEKLIEFRASTPDDEDQGKEKLQ